MEDFEEALRNIDVFCRTLVKKIVEDDDSSQRITVEPMENLLRRKYLIEESLGSNPSAKYLIPVPDAEEPLIDMFDGKDYVKIFMQCRCQGKDVEVHTDIDNNIEICIEECRKLNLPAANLSIENMVVKCNNNSVLEISIPKVEATAGCNKQLLN
jgi:hypothetical protein